MGYDTKFKGSFALNKRLSEEHHHFLNDFANKRHEYPATPSGYCQWVPSLDGWTIEWDQGEKFYDYVDWIKHLIQNYFILWGYVLNGTVRYRGENFDDVGQIVITDNFVEDVRDEE